MLRMHHQRNEHAQIFMEYVIIIGAVTLILIAMSTMIKRSTQGMIKVVADQIGEQVNAEQDFDEDSFLESSYTTTRAVTSKTKQEETGTITYYFGDEVTSESNTQIQMGFTEED